MQQSIINSTNNQQEYKDHQICINFFSSFFSNEFIKRLLELDLPPPMDQAFFAVINL